MEADGVYIRANVNTAAKRRRAVASYGSHSTLFCTIILAPITLRLCTLVQERRNGISVALARRDLRISVFLEHTSHTSHVLLTDKLTTLSDRVACSAE
jgi:hypothetical protein